MGAKGFVIAEEGHVVNILPPVDVAGGKTSDVFSMKGHSHATILVQAGSTNAAAGTITILACDDFTPSNTTAIAFACYKCETAAGDVLGARTAVAAAGFTVSGNDNVMYAIEIDAAELPAGKPNLQLAWSAPGGATIGSAIAVLSGSRIAAEQSATAIA